MGDKRVQEKKWIPDDRSDGYVEKAVRDAVRIAGRTLKKRPKDKGYVVEAIDAAVRAAR